MVRIIWNLSRTGRVLPFQGEKHSCQDSCRSTKQVILYGKVKNLNDELRGTFINNRFLFDDPDHYHVGSTR